MDLGFAERSDHLSPKKSVLIMKFSPHNKFTIVHVDRCSIFKLFAFFIF